MKCFQAWYFMIKIFERHHYMTESSKQEKFITKVSSVYLREKFRERRPQAYDQMSLVPAVYYIRLFIIAGWINFLVIHFRTEQQGIGIFRSTEFIACMKYGFSIQCTTNILHVQRNELVSLMFRCVYWIS